MLTSKDGKPSSRARSAARQGARPFAATASSTRKSRAVTPPDRAAGAAGAPKSRITSS